MAPDEPPDRVSYNLEESLELLAALEDARDLLPTVTTWPSWHNLSTK